MDSTAPFFFSAKLYPRRPALMWIGGGVTYAMLAQCVLSAARHIRAAGVTRDDLVAIDIQDAHRHVIVMLALMHLGIGSASLDAGRREAAEAGGVNVIVADHAVAGGSSRIIKTSEDWFAPRPDLPAPGDCGFRNEQDIFRIKMTSGTTGRPQPVPMNVRDFLFGVDENRYFDTGGRVLSMFGFSSGVGARALLRALHRGGTFCLAGNAQGAYDTIQLCGVEQLLASTIQLRELTLCAKEAREPLHSLKSVLAGGSSISTRMIAEAQRYVCNNIISHYASSQGGFVAIAPVALLDGRPGAAGFVIPGVEVETAGADGERLPPGATGEVRVRSYYTQERQPMLKDAAAAGFRDGWFYPGDIGRVEKDGMLIIEGRVSELVNIGGVKIAPELADEVLTGLPGVNDAAAFGFKNEHGEEELWAAVVSAAPPDIPGLLAACRTQLGSGAPSVILQAASIPRNASGKVMRAALRAEVEALITRG